MQILFIMLIASVNTFLHLRLINPISLGSTMPEYGSVKYGIIEWRINMSIVYSNDSVTVLSVYTTSYIIPWLYAAFAIQL